ncbi:hypothetical protein [Cohnella sp. AR92]|uniref:hypothetical protein n=1 Tax=Cohnella sp. AR92 TaxID=648716 RepID=UPI000F8CA506|nr:hypothetical protein [Cohnella sp. AR92]RUS47549.1 hypothetical protein ELR57_07055 [Cohnella sp. AR92]
MIKLTEVTLNGRDDIITESAVYIPENAVVKPWKIRYSLVTVPNAGAYVVKEAPSEVVRKIMEYKLAKWRYPSSVLHDSQEGLNKNVDELIRLAGLEADHA